MDDHTLANLLRVAADRLCPAPAAPAAGMRAVRASYFSSQAGGEPVFARCVTQAAESGAGIAKARAGSPFNWAPGEAERISLRPIRHDDLWDLRNTIVGLHWTAEEVDYSADKKDWDTRMGPEERHFVRMQLAFFARVDIDVLKNLNANFSEEVDCLEARFLFAAQQEQECTHAESYALQIEAVMTGAERAETLEAVRHLPAVAALREWALRWIGRDAPLGERLVAWAFVEGVQFQGPFCSLQWLRERNLLPGITLANSFIARDEGVHTADLCLLVRKYLADWARPAPARAWEIFESGMVAVDALVAEALPARLIGMNDVLMKEYVRYQADFVLGEMGYDCVFGAKNPFPFMDKLALNEVSKGNFFETRISSYQSVMHPGASRLAIDKSPIDEA
jgi:ribonucleotide reductase beta subunit family protein with ferritin-like domain